MMKIIETKSKYKNEYLPKFGNSFFIYLYSIVIFSFIYLFIYTKIKIK